MVADYILTSYMQSYMRRTMSFGGDAPLREWMPPRQHSASPLLLYLHVPFCEELCPFCSFNRIKFNPLVSGDYFEALRDEIRIYADLGYQFDSVYVGGGTPTIVPAELDATLRLVRELWPIKRISSETNPNHLVPATLAMLRDVGVDRLSVGVQSFNDDVLRGIGRYDRYGSGAQILERLSVARDYVDALNVDMIFNYPMQTEDMLRSDLDTVRTVDAEQITFYPLMSAKARKEHMRREHRRRELRFYRLITERLSDRYRPTSAWCFSRMDGPDEAASAEGALIDEYIVDYDDYAGLGSGSFGYLHGTLYSNTFNIPEYVRHLQNGRLPIVARKEFSRFEQIRYDVLMKLFGGSLAIRFLRQKYRGPALIRVWKEIVFFRLVGAIRIRHGEITLTEKGYYLWVVLMREFFTGVNLFRERCMTAIDPSMTVPGRTHLPVRGSSVHNEDGGSS